MTVLVVGQVARDLVLCVDDAPGAQESVSATRRIETLGGKGANHAVALAQLGVPVALLGVVGDDPVGDAVLDRARADGIDVSPVVRRPGVQTGLVVNVVDAHGHWRYVEDLPEATMLTPEDVTGAPSARCVVVQLQQPSDAALAATRGSTGLVMLEGAPDGHRDELLDKADVVRADATEARLLTGEDLDSPAAAVHEATDLLRRHDLAMVAFGIEDGDVFVWPDGTRVFGHGDAKVVDTTGAGDAMSAALVSVLLSGGQPHEAAELAMAAAAATVEHPGGRPNLTPARLRHFLRRVHSMARG
jgi:ribokinase